MSQFEYRDIDGSLVAAFCFRYARLKAGAKCLLEVSIEVWA